MIALSTLRYNGLRVIRAEATQNENDILPGVVSAAKAQAIARELLLAVTTHSAAESAHDRQLAADSIEQLLRIAAQNDDAYRATIVDEGDRQLYGAMREAQDRVTTAYRNASADIVLSDAELRTLLRP